MVVLKKYRKYHKGSRIDLESLNLFNIKIRNGQKNSDEIEIDVIIEGNNKDFVRALFSYSNINHWFKKYFSK